MKDFRKNKIWFNAANVWRFDSAAAGDKRVLHERRLARSLTLRDDVT